MLRELIQEFPEIYLARLIDNELRYGELESYFFQDQGIKNLFHCWGRIIFNQLSSVPRVYFLFSFVLF